MADPFPRANPDSPKFFMILLFTNNVQAMPDIAFDTMADCTRTAKASVARTRNLPYDSVPYVCVSAPGQKQAVKLFLDRL